MEINVAEGMSTALNIGVIITLRRGLNQHQTLASGGGRNNRERVETIQFSRSLLISPSLLYNSLLQHTKPLSGRQDTTHKFHHGNIWIKGGLAWCQDRPGVSLQP